MFDTIVHALKSHAQERPEAPAIVAGNNALSYGELWRRIRGFANYLHSAGLRRGQCVVMQSEQTLEFAVCHYGTHLAGGIFTPLERSSSKAAIEAIAAQTSAHIVVSRTQVDWPLCADTAQLRALSLAHVGDAREPDMPNPEDPVELLFTTGTTGMPKGVLCSYRSLVGVAENLIQGMGYKPNTLMLVPGQVSHANAIRKLSSAYLNGSAVMLLDGVGDMNAFYAALDRWPVTALCLPPAAIRMLLVLSEDRLGRYRDQIDFIESASSVLPEGDKHRMCELLPNTRLFNCYGTSEAGSSCMYDYNRERGLTACIGRPAVNAKFLVLDDDGREMRSSRENMGLISYGGKMNMLGYWKDPELTARTMVNGFIRTSDVGYIDGEGRVYVIGRRDDVINVGGNKVAPDEVEQAALMLPGIAECGCARMPDPISGEAIKLFVVMKPGAAFDPAGIREALKGMLPDFKLPKRIEQRDQLPRASNGKLQRRALQ